MYESLIDFEKALIWIIQKNAPSADFFVHPSFVRTSLDFEHTTPRYSHYASTHEHWDGSVLFTSTQLEFLPSDVVKLTIYRFQYQLEGKTIIRYDDAPHFPHHPTFPHHKHIGEKEIAYACYAPAIEEILQEIEHILAGGTVKRPIVI